MTAIDDTDWEREEAEVDADPVHEPVAALGYTEDDVEWWKTRFLAVCGQAIYSKCLLDHARYAIARANKAARVVTLP